MNKLVYAAAGGIAVVAVAVFFILGPGMALPGQQERPEMQVIPPVVTIKDISVTNVGDNGAQVQVVFAVENLNQRLMYLEAIQYNLFVNGKFVAGGQWGDIPQGFLAGSDTLTPVPSEGQIPSLRPQPHPVTRSMVADEWDSMVDGTATYTISGTSAYRLTAANLQTTAEEQPFDLTFP